MKPLEDRTKQRRTCQVTDVPTVESRDKTTVCETVDVWSVLLRYYLYCLLKGGTTMQVIFC